jgi:hypothetical protein
MLNRDECDVLRELRRSSRIFDVLKSCTGTELQIQNKLRAEFPDDVVRAALSLQELRHKARDKFSRADQMWFDRKGLEQATPELVARHKARRFRGCVRDYCCGIGADSLALAEHCRVEAYDLNPAACLRAKWNAEAYGVESNLTVVCADVQTLTATDDLVHIDPDRRPEGRGRALRLEEGVPGLDFLLQLMNDYPGGAVKVSPASNFPGKFPGTEAELVSVGGECKEATMWFGDLAGDNPFRATVLPAGETIAGHPLDFQAELSELGRYLYEPDPAVVRAGLVDLAAEHLNLQRLDESEEYLTSETLIESPFVRAFEVLAQLPNNDREIRRYFRQGDFGQVEIKCRHVPIQVEAVRRKLPLQGRRPSVLVYARIGGRTQAVVCRRVG